MNTTTIATIIISRGSNPPVELAVSPDLATIIYRDWNTGGDAHGRPLNEAALSTALNVSDGWVATEIDVALRSGCGLNSWRHMPLSEIGDRVYSSVGCMCGWRASAYFGGRSMDDLDAMHDAYSNHRYRMFAIRAAVAGKVRAALAAGSLRWELDDGIRSHLAAVAP